MLKTYVPRRLGMSRQPNSEQLKAIEHTGGVLLSAGAGSGKTFVLIHHVLYLANLWKKECLEQETDIGRILYLQKKFSEVVLMTFTKEAAGELSYRLQKRVEEEINENFNESFFWEYVLESIGSMTLTTIHGFCAKLLSQGYILDFDPQAKLLSELEFRNKIKSLINRWFDLQKENDQNKDFLEIVVANKKNLLDSFCKIFADAKIRDSWNTHDPELASQKDLSTIIEKILEIEGIEDALDEINLDGLESEISKGWHINLSAYNNLIRNHGLNDYEGIEAFLNYFAGIKSFRGPAPKFGREDIKAQMESIKALRKFLRDNHENFRACFGEEKEFFRRWINATYEIFNYIEKNYLNIKGINFSDYEYYVLKGLRNPRVVEKIANNYKYLIVDEFQDTSSIQFEIIEKIIKSNFQKLFCVGDVKQAIYGFRGGEIDVFRKCQNLIAQNLELNNNYRSFKNVISFNNRFFDHIFKMGLRFEGVDKFSVEVVPQIVPTEVERSGDGKINRLLVEVENPSERKVKTDEILEIEADVVLKKCKQLLDESDDEKICILFSKLTPLRFLLKKLINEKVDFVSQVKIKIDEDPFLSIFKVLIEYSLEKNKDDQKVNSKAMQIAGYLSYLGSSQKDISHVAQAMSVFEKSIGTLGVYFSTQICFYTLGISNSSYENNDLIIEQICELAMDDTSLIWLLLNENRDKNYSKKFHQGSGRIIIMTAHSSKGLEFDHVILCGIHNNGRRIPDLDYFGTLPGSFKWKSDISQRKPYISPEMLLEKTLSYKKDFSESKRLFYVANTRAIKSLSFCHLISAEDGSTFYKDKSSWIRALDSFDLKTNNIIDSHFNYAFSEVEEKNTGNMPLFHLDNLGLLPVERTSNEILACIPELSVTRMTSLAQCPTKFYLMNICKISPDEDWFEKTGLYKESLDENLFKKSEETEFEFNEYESFGAQRGTFIHESLHKLITRNLVIPREVSKEKDLLAMNWAKSELETLVKDYDFIAETPIKFLFFGTMISGTPDLILKPKQNNQFKIIDYKTGKFSEDKTEPYWFQLKIYAFSLYVMEKTMIDQGISIELWFVDEQKCYTLEVNYQELREELFQFWRRVENLSEKNTQHCKHCSFGNLCHFGTDFFASI